MTLCTKTLLGDPVPSLEPAIFPRPAAVADLKVVLEVQSKYWSSICFNKDLPDTDVLTEPEKFGNFEDVWINGVHVELSKLVRDSDVPNHSHDVHGTVPIEEILSKLSLNDNDDKPNGDSSSSQQESNQQTGGETSSGGTSSFQPNMLQPSGSQQTATDHITQSLQVYLSSNFLIYIVFEYISVLMLAV